MEDDDAWHQREQEEMQQSDAWEALLAYEQMRKRNGCAQKIIVYDQEDLFDGWMRTTS